MKKYLLLIALLFSLAAQSQFSVLRAPKYAGTNSLGFIPVSKDSGGYSIVNHLSIQDIITLVGTGSGGTTLNGNGFVFATGTTISYVPTLDTTYFTSFFTKVRASLAVVSYTGSYNDLSSKPTIPAAQVNSDWNAVSGLAQILNKPTIPTNTNQLTNGSGYYAPSDTLSTLSTIPNRNKLSDTLKATLVPKTMTITINGTTFDHTANRTWNVGTLTLNDSATFSTLANRNKLSDTLKATLTPQSRTIGIGGFNFSLIGDRTWSIGAQLPGTVAQMTAASAAINTTETKLMNTASIAANQFTAGSSYRVILYGTCTSTGANASNFRARIGTTGGNTDAVVGVVTPTAAASGTTVPFKVTFILTVRTSGSTGTMAGEGDLNNNGVTGVSAAADVIGTVSSITVNTTVANIISVWYVSGASTTTCTFQLGTIECIKI